ncbi:tripeptidyl-peptidase-like protein [Apodospora peruviana]|uniref:tripeptidyl-peptidase II n=1 Tax=Apodospora peruviana TaxID=516989 RepID=A0AAE0M3P7_9PEZI|nr:tripeptidyl-peptidase-like protein [Apodospora peruviana]
MGIPLNPVAASLLWLLLGLSLLASAAPTVILEQTNGHRPPTGWRFHSNASASDRMTLSIAIRESKMVELKDKLAWRWHAHPNHAPRSVADFEPNLSRAQVNQFRQPQRAVTNAVAGWLKSNGIRNPRISGSWITFDVSVRAAKSLFQAESLAYYSYIGVAGEDAKPVLRALSYRVPTWLRHDIDFVHPLTNFMPPRDNKRRKNDMLRRKRVKPNHAQQDLSTPPDKADEEEVREIDMPCLTGTFPECIRKLYNLTYTPASSTPSPVRFGIGGFLEQWIMYEDVDNFLASYSPEIAESSYDFTVELLRGATNPQDDISYAGIEASLDVEYAMALGHPTNVTYYLTGGRGTKLDRNGTALPEADSDNEPYLEFFQDLLDKPDNELPHVLSISYADDENGVPLPYAKRVCDMIAALTARGVSVLAATGDGGAAGTGQTQCITNDGTNRKALVPTFPASCPYVTTVGATENVGPPLTAADFSSGGFSNYFPRPAWQDEVVSPFLANLAGTQDAERLGLFNHSGRAMPDISAIGSGFQIQFGGTMIEVLGTSASTPVVAAMVALVNDKRMRAGKSSLGWLNPLLYSAEVRAVLRDVVTGASQGCNFPDGTHSAGWPAVKGYDCVTGLGTVNDFHDFLAVLS